MSAKHALLGFLLQRSSYPYELGDRLEQRLGPAYKVNSGQLSQIVKRMEADGLIERVDPDAQGPKERHVFKATARGAEDFERWFAQETKVAPHAPGAHGQARARRPHAPGRGAGADRRL